MNAAVKVRAVILEGEADAETVAVLREAMEAPELSVVFALPTVGKIVERVAYETGVLPAKIMGDGRAPGAVRCRFAVAWIARRFGRHSLAQIGRVLGDRDHSTIAHALVRAQVMRQRDPAFLALTDKVSDHFMKECLL